MGFGCINSCSLPFFFTLDGHGGNGCIVGDNII